MKIAIGADRLAIGLKDAVIEHLQEQGHEVVDLGMKTPENSIDYIDTACNVAKAVSGKEADRGIIICGSGVGVSIVANKFKGISAARVESVWSAQNCREINNANVITFGGLMLAPRMACDIVDTFLNTEFAPGATPERRAMLQGFLDKIAALEDQLIG